MTPFIALLISLAIEIPIILLLTHFLQRFSSLVELLAMFALACGATLLTHPLAWTSNLVMIYNLEFPARIIIIEAIVFFIEGFLYAQVLDLGWKKGLYLSFIANLASYCVGMIFFKFMS
ncbi:hypothetical protein NIES267_23150 [Calothrix parasitica NIES-267]|uniref:Uncharacterized protein n=1 Tax=Calothrix parasitica NIES-267 TaxID=1973488 RepID=A0A1Z4LNL7_9CYAN|nr:hypothetical protein NIES267_23150 [Calothrix parasitica NIES-267]